MFKVHIYITVLKVNQVGGDSTITICNLQLQAVSEYHSFHLVALSTSDHREFGFNQSTEE